MFMATTTATFSRGMTTDDQGSPVGDDKPYAEKIPVAITTKTRTTSNPSNGVAQTTRTYTARVRSNFDVQKGDRLTDDRTGDQYEIDDVTSTLSLAQTTSCILDIRRVVI